MYGRLFALAFSVALSGCVASAQSQPTIVGSVTPQQWAETCEPWDDWDKPAPPFKIHGDTYYVGTCGISAILVQNGEEFSLIDVGTEKGADVVMGNVRKLSFDLTKLWAIFMSHEHHDHIGGIAKIKETSGAIVIASLISANALMDGEIDEFDPQFGLHGPIPKIEKPMIIGRGEYRFFMDVAGLTPIETPGHSPGALSWQWESCDGDDCKTIVYADSLSPISRDGYKFSDHPRYVAKFRAGLDRLAELDCDILLTPHPSHSQMVKRAATGSFVGGVTCAEYAAKKHRDLDERLAKENAEEKAEP